MLQSIESKINNADLNLEAEAVQSDEESSYLQIESTITGAHQSFELADVEGDIVDTTEMDTMIQEAQNALYTVDDTDYESTTNEISLKSGYITATLQDTGTAEVSVNSDTDAVMEEVESFITEYNETMDFLESDPMRENYNLYDSSGQIFNLFQDWQAGLLFSLYS